MSNATVATVATVDKKEFVARLATLNRIVDKKGYVPVLQNIYVGIEPGAVTLRSTDLEISELSTIPAATDGVGAVTIPAAMMLKLLRKAPKAADSITLSVDTEDTALDITCGTLSLHLKGIDAEEFPAMPTVVHDAMLKFESGELMVALNQVLPAISTDETRPLLTGVDFRVNDGVLTLATADGFRLAVRKLTIDYTGESFEAVVPGRMLAEVARELKGQTEPATISFSKEYVKVETETLTVISAPVDGNFPDYRQIIPAEVASHITFQASDMLAALSVVEPISKECANIVQLKTDDGNLKVVATSAEMGTASQSIPAKIEGEGGHIAFNVKYIKDAIKCVGRNTISMGMNTWKEPGVFEPVGRYDYVHVLIPMHLDRDKTHSSD